MGIKFGEVSTGSTCAETTPADEIETLNKTAEQFSINSNDGSLFLVAAQRCLEKNHSRILLDFLQDPEHKQLLEFVGWDLMKIVFLFLPDENESDCQNILFFTCNTCNPREMCLSLGELLSCHLTWQKLIILLHLLQETCQRLEGRVAKIFSSILSSLCRCLRSREDKFDHLPEILELTLEFLRPYVEKLRNWHLGMQSASNDIKELVAEFESFLVNLLEFPFAVLDLSTCGASQKPVLETKSEHDCGELCKYGGFAVTIVDFLGCIECSSFKYLLEYGFYQNKLNPEPSCELAGDPDEESSLGLPYIGLGCLAFLVHEHIEADFVPVVLTGGYILKTTVIYVNVMLISDQISVVDKGIRLLLAILNLIEPETLDHIHYEEGEVLKLAGVLMKLMTHGEKSDIRQKSVCGLRELLNRFQPRGRYKHLRLLYQSCNHSGVAEFLILILKEEIVKSLERVGEDEWFGGSNLVSFLMEIFCIPPKWFQSEYEIVEERSRILAALNLFRFLFIRDKENKTRFHTIIWDLEKSFLKPLMDAASLSKAKFKMSIKEKMDEIAGKVIAPKCDEGEEIFSVVTPDGCPLEKGSLQEQLEVLESAVLTVDMIESVLVRIEEICQAQRSQNMNLDN